MEEKLEIKGEYDSVGDLIAELKYYPEDMPIRIEGKYISRIREKGDICHVEIIHPNDRERHQ